MTLKTKIVFFSLSAFFVLFVSGYAFYQHRATDKKYLTVVDLLEDISHVASFIAQEVLVGNPDSPAIKRRIHQIPNKTSKLQEILLAEYKPVGLAEVEIMFVRIQRTIDKSLAGSTFEKPLKQQVRNEVKKIQSAVDSLRLMARDRINKIQKKDEALAYALIFILSMYILGVLFYLIGFIVKPILVLSGQIEEIENGKRTEIIKSNRDDELGRLNQYVRRAISDLARKNIELQAEVNERKKIEKSLRHSTMMLENVLNNTNPICITGDNFDVLQANKAYYQIWPQAENETGSVKCYESRFGDLCHSAECPLIQIKNGKENVVVEAKKTKECGGEIDFIITANCFRNDKGELIGIVESFQDITERKRAEEERVNLNNRLRQAQKMEAIGTLAGGIAHDFNNILTVILGYTELAQRNIKEKPDVLRDLDGIYSAGLKARDLVNQILTISRNTEQKKTPVQVYIIVKEAIKMVHSAMPSTIDIQTEMQSNSSVFADPVQVHQVVMNLFTNAYHAMSKKGGVLTIRLVDVEADNTNISADHKTECEKMLLLEVRDTGIGIEPQNIDKIFEPYFTTKSQSEGTGLGLSVVHGIVESQGGFVVVESEVGEGTAFKVYLPVYTGAPLSCSQESTEAHNLKGNERVMIVDDEREIVELVQSSLSSYGYRTTAFCNALEALDELFRKPDHFDLVITDMTMPGVTGAELAKKIVELRENIPVILYTGHSDLIDQEKASMIGISRFLKKPITTENLARVVRELLDSSHAISVSEENEQVLN